MDNLLRGAIRRREIESAVLSVEGDPAAKMRCLGCRAVLVESPMAMYCMECLPSSRKSPARKQEWDAFVQERRALLDEVARNVGQQLELEEAMREGAKRCSRPGCDRSLRADNGKGLCSDIRKCGGTKMALAEPPELTPPPQIRAAVAVKPVRTSNEETITRFRMLASALNFDPDEVLAGFARGWLDRASEAVRKEPTLFSQIFDPMVGR